jgi:hypothetical protein
MYFAFFKNDALAKGAKKRCNPPDLRVGFV